MDENEVRRRLTNQAPRSHVVSHALDRLTDAAAHFGEEVARTVPDGREQALAVTKIEEALAWAKKGVALYQVEVDPNAIT